MDLIDRQDAIRETWREPTYFDPLNVMTEMRDRLEALPTIDAVPVVRCRDCRYYRRSSITSRRHCTYIFQIYLQTPNDFYCGWGERRTDA